mgnify:CR=1 FL=1
MKLPERMLRRMAGDPLVIDTDEGVRSDASYESMAKLRPVFKKDGVITAGNASQLSDGAAAMVLMTDDKAKDLGVTPMAKVTGYATGGLEPELTVVFDLDPAAGVARARSLNAAGDGRESRLDDEPARFHEQVREAYLRLAETVPERVRVVDAGGSPDEVFDRLCALLPEELR